jgi:hypothetical protein
MLVVVSSEINGWPFVSQLAGLACDGIKVFRTSTLADPFFTFGIFGITFWCGGIVIQGG